MNFNCLQNEWALNKKVHIYRAGEREGKKCDNLVISTAQNSDSFLVLHS